MPGKQLKELSAIGMMGEGIVGFIKPRQVYAPMEIMQNLKPFISLNKEG